MDITRLEEALHLSQNQEEADFSSFDLQDREFIKYVLPELERWRWKRLYLCENSVGDDGVIALAKILRSASCLLEELDLGWNQVGDDGLMELSRVLPGTSLTELVLHSNEIGDKSVAQLAAVLPQTEINTLDLCANEITDKSAKMLADILPNTLLSSIDIGQNQITDEGASALLKAMRRSQVTILNLQGNQIRDSSILNAIEVTEELVRTDFRIIVALCSAKIIPRLGVHSKVRLLPCDVLRRLKQMMYSVPEPRQQSCEIFEEE